MGRLHPINPAARFHVRSKPVLTDDDVKAMAAAAESHAREHNWNVTIAIVDDGGHLLHLHRLDGAGASTAEMATGKARTAVLGRRETKVYEDTIKQGRTAFLSAPLTAMLEGGVPIFVGADIVGAVGVSGVKSEQDAQIAKAGIAALGIENA
nr:heme-binding protein [Caballeronia sp. BR00000012568055]